MSSTRFPRSDASLNFERMWLDLPHSGAIPERRNFHPRLAKSFLRHIVLAIPPSTEDSVVRITLVGDAIRQQVQGEMAGLNYLDFLDDEARRRQAVERVRELFEKPCGHRWVAPVHYEREFSQYWEITAFPLAASGNRPAAILALVRPFDALADTRRTRRRIVSIEAPVQFDIIDIVR